MSEKKETPFERKKRLFDSVANTADGLEMLREIFELTNYDKSVMRFNQETSELNEKATIYNVSKRDVWLSIRQNLSPHLRAKIENQEENNVRK